MRKNEKIFNRSVCFTFFESYLEGAEKYKEVFNVEIAYGYLCGLIRYALYKEEAEDPMINALVSPLKNTIDANQDKRSNGFGRENKEMTEAIIRYKDEHPEATQREIADAVACSVGKVNKVLSSNTNSNINDNNNTNLNSNTMNVNVNTIHNSKESANALVKKRNLEDLEDKDLEDLLKDLRLGKKSGMTYAVMYKKYNLANGVLSKESQEKIKEIQKERKEERYFQEQEDAIKRLNLYANIDYEKLSEQRRNAEKKQEDSFVDDYLDFDLVG